MIKKLILLIVLVSGGIAYYLWDKGELNPEGIKSLADTVKNADKDDLKTFMHKTGEAFELTSGKVMDFGATLKDELSKVDWSEVRESMGLSEKDLSEYKDSLAFVFDDSHSSPEQQVTSAKPESASEESDPSPVAVTQKAISTDTAVSTKSVKAPPKEPVPSARPTKHPKKPSPPPPPRHWTLGMKYLDQAKEENKKGLPGKPNHISHLRKAVSLYQKSIKELQTSLKREKLSQEQKAEIEKIMPKIQQQIYWGKKMDRV